LICFDVKKHIVTWYDLIGMAHELEWHMNIRMFQNLLSPYNITSSESHVITGTEYDEKFSTKIAPPTYFCLFSSFPLYVKILL